MKKKFQKAAAVVLAVSMAVGLAACGKQTEQTGGGRKNGITFIEQSVSETQPTLAPSDRGDISKKPE